MIECWKIIKKFPNYEISNLGKVRNIKLKKTHQVRISKFGYDRVHLRKDNKEFNKFMHVLVYNTFIGKIPNGYEINHKDGNKLNNKIDNLELTTRSGNIKHAYENNLMDRKGIKHPRSILKENDIIKIRKLLKNGFTQRYIGELFGVKRSTIQNIKCNKNWKHIKGGE
jgi:hypothetical protein